MSDAENKPLDQAELESRFTTAWQQVEEYWEGREPGGENEANDPQHRLAPEFFNLYLAHRPSDVATGALQFAFNMWSNLDGGSLILEQKLAEIDSEESSIEAISQSVLNAYQRDDRQAEGETRFQQLLEQLPSLAARSRMLTSQARSWMWDGDAQKARQACEQILAWQADESSMEQARSFLHELDHLNVGQTAPTFVHQDIAGKTIDLAKYRGQVVLLDFWATWCGPCVAEFPHLRRVADKFGDKAFTLISISLDDKIEAAQQIIEKEKLTWTHLCEGGWDSALSKLYNVMGIPQAYLLDQAGRIHAKGLRGHELDHAIEALLGSENPVQ